MERRKFLVGVGSASVAGGAIMGSGAFSSVAADRGILIDVADDADAYLGLEKCEGSPNGSYVSTTTGANGADIMQIDMSEDNPTVDENNESLGYGVNDSAISVFHNVWQICNNGKQDACVWIDVDPVVSGDSQAVSFYLGDDPNAVFEGETVIELGVGDCQCIGMKIDTTFDWDQDNGLNWLDDDEEVNLRVHADVDCPTLIRGDAGVYGIERNDDQIHRINIENGDIERTIVGMIDSETAGDYPNGITFDEDNGYWYVADEGGKLIESDGFVHQEELGTLAGGSNVAGAAMVPESYSDSGSSEYYFIAQHGDELKKAVIDDGDFDIEHVVTFKEIGGIVLGDLAIAEIGGELMLYGSAVTSSLGGAFFEVSLDKDPVEYDIIASEEHNDDPDEHAFGMQVAFSEGDLYATPTMDDEWHTVDLGNGQTTELGEFGELYNDLGELEFQSF